MPLAPAHCLPLGNYIVLKYSDIPQTVEYNITILHHHRGYVIQIPINPNAMPGVKHKVHELKKYAVATLYPETNLYSEFSGTTSTGPASTRWTWCSSATTCRLITWTVPTE